MLEPYIEKARALFTDVTGVMRRRLLGANNERLDLLLDSFNKLDARQRMTALAGLGFGIAVVVFAALWFYMSRVDALKTELNDSFAALHNLQSLRNDYQVEQQRFDNLVQLVTHKTQGVKLKPFFEKTAKDIGVQVEIMNEQKTPLPPENPLSTRMQYTSAELRFNKISIPRLLKVMVEVEKSNNFFTTDSLQIRGLYGTRLFFQGTIKVRGYSVGEL